MFAVKLTKKFIKNSTSFVKKLQSLLESQLLQRKIVPKNCQLRLYVRSKGQGIASNNKNRNLETLKVRKPGSAGAFDEVFRSEKTLCGYKNYWRLGTLVRDLATPLLQRAKSFDHIDTHNTVLALHLSNFDFLHGRYNKLNDTIADHFSGGRVARKPVLEHFSQKSRSLKNSIKSPKSTVETNTDNNSSISNSLPHLAPEALDKLVNVTQREVADLDMVRTQRIDRNFLSDQSYQSAEIKTSSKPKQRGGSILDQLAQRPSKPVNRKKKFDLSTIAEIIISDSD